MKTLIMSMMLLMALTGCLNPDSYPRIENQEQLSPFFVYETINGKEYISIEKSKCLSRTYKISKEFIGAIDKAVKLNIKECQKVVGYSPKEYGVFATWLENFRHWLLQF